MLDKFIRQVLSNRKTARHYLKQFVPKEITAQLDFRTLRLSSNSFVDEKLKEHISDLVYLCDFKDKREKSQKVRMSFLFEHKSYLPKFPHLQLMRYLLEAWEYDARESKGLNLTIPIVLYHGKRKWNYKSFNEYFTLPDKSLNRFIPSFEYLLTDLSQFSDDDILNLERGFLLNTLLALKYSRNKKYLLENLLTIFKYGEIHVQTESGRHFIRVMNTYFFQTNSFDEKELNLYHESFPKSLKKIAMSTYDMLINKGIELAIKKIIIKNPDYSDAKIAEMMDFPIAVIAKVRRTIKSKK